MSVIEVGNHVVIMELDTTKIERSAECKFFLMRNDAAGSVRKISSTRAAWILVVNPPRERPRAWSPPFLGAPAAAGGYTLRCRG